MVRQYAERKRLKVAELGLRGMRCFKRLFICEDSAVGHDWWKMARDTGTSKNTHNALATGLQRLFANPLTVFRSIPPSNLTSWLAALSTTTRTFPSFLSITRSFANEKTNSTSRGYTAISILRLRQSHCCISKKKKKSETRLIKDH